MKMTLFKLLTISHLLKDNHWKVPKQTHCRYWLEGKSHRHYSLHTVSAKTAGSHSTCAIWKIFICSTLIASFFYHWLLTKLIPNLCLCKQLLNVYTFQPQTFKNLVYEMDLKLLILEKSWPEIKIEFMLWTTYYALSCRRLCMKNV